MATDASRTTITTEESPEIIGLADGVTDLSRPFFTVPLTLNSLHSQHVLTRGYVPAAEGIFSMAVKLPALIARVRAKDSPATKGDTDDVQDAIYKRLEDFSAELKGEQDRLAKMAEANGIPLDGVNYTAAKKYLIQVSSPRANNLVRMVADFDALMGTLDALWLTAIIKEKHYSAATYDWKRRALRVTDHIRQVANRTMTAASRTAAAQRGRAKDEASLNDDAPTTTEIPAIESDANDSIGVDSAAIPASGASESPARAAPKKRNSAQNPQASESAEA